MFFRIIKKSVLNIKNYKKKFFRKKNKNYTVFACYTFVLFFKQAIQYLKTRQISRIFLGTIRFNLDSSKEYPDIPISYIEEFEYLSYYWVQIANRYYRGIFNIYESELVNIFDKTEVYLNARYLISLVELTLKGTSKKNFVFFSPSSGNRIVDQLFKKYYKKKYDLNIKILYLSKIIKPLNDIYFLFKKLKFNKACFTRPFLMSKSNLSNKKSNKIFIHHKLIKDRDPENILLKELSKKNDFISLNFISFLQIGSQNKIQFIHNLTKFITQFLRKNCLVLITHNLFLESIQLLSNYIYYLCCIKTIEKLDIKTIVVTYIDLNYENILYKACRDTKTVSIFYDFSMGYPITKNCIGRSQIDTDRNPTYLVTCGKQRCNQYNFANRYKYSIAKTIPINSVSPLVEYARKASKKRLNLDNDVHLKYYLSKGIKISIFDNIYGYNFYINEKDIFECINTLKASPVDKIVLCHNKAKGFLNSHILNSGLTHIFQKKANFSNVFFSDFIISIGLQGAAIKAAFAFQKPLLFFTENSIFFEDSNFYLKEPDNQKVIKLIKNLTYDSELLSKALSNEDRYEDFYSKIKENSKKLLNMFNLTEDLETASQVIENLIQKNLV